jgi:putative intracellular protease/amidase
MVLSHNSVLPSVYCAINRGAPIERILMSSGTPPRRQALIVVSSATHLPLSLPVAHTGVSTGFFTVELARVLERFEDEYDFTFVTPDGRPPQIDINGESLPFRSMSRTATSTVSSALELGLGCTITGYRMRRAALADRREGELAVIRRHMGKLAVSEVLPGTDRDAAAYRADLVESMRPLEERVFLSPQELMGRHRDPADPVDLADFDFVHMPGGHAPMVDFVDNPWLGELVNSLHESGVLISLICHAPVVMASTKYRVSREGAVHIHSTHAFSGARLTTVPRHGEQIALSMAYPKVPREKTRLEYFVDDTLRSEGYDVITSVDPTGVRLVWDEEVSLLTGNGPQSVDAQAHRLRDLVDARVGSSRQVV